MIVHRLDDPQATILFRTGKARGHDEITMLSELLTSARPQGHVVVDVGANFGAFSLAFSKLAGAGGKIIAIEPQRLLFYMLAGSVALNGALNVNCIHAAVGGSTGRIEAPQFDYASPLSFGSVEFGPQQQEQLAQARLHEPGKTDFVPLITLDSLDLPRVDLLKIDAQGMELDVLNGAVNLIRRCRPFIYIEWLKVGHGALRDALVRLGYAVQEKPHENFLAFPRD